MNIILFGPEDLARKLPSQDPRARHIIDVLRCAVGDSFDAGLIDGPRGKATLTTQDDDGLVLAFEWGSQPAPVEPLALIVGMCRPQTMRRVLREAAAMGVERMRFPRTERGEATYADSSLWTTGEYERHVRTGVEQAFATQIPAIEFGMSLQEALAIETDVRLALDNYENTEPLHRVLIDDGASVAVVVGSERGWSAGERDQLRGARYSLVGLGPRVLRTEVALVAGLSLIKAATGSWDAGPTPDSRVG